jgi:DNA invertase Pin-like site-specific DNA recombinase
MSAQKEAVLQLVAEQKERGRPVRETLVTLGVARSTYYRWKKSDRMRPDRASGG